MLSISSRIHIHQEIPGHLALYPRLFWAQRTLAALLSMHFIHEHILRFFLKCLHGLRSFFVLSFFLLLHIAYQPALQTWQYLKVIVRHLLLLLHRRSWLDVGWCFPLWARQCIFLSLFGSLWSRIPGFLFTSCWFANCWSRKGTLFLQRIASIVTWVCL